MNSIIWIGLVAVYDRHSPCHAFYILKRGGRFHINYVYTRSEITRRAIEINAKRLVTKHVTFMFMSEKAMENSHKKCYDFTIQTHHTLNMLAILIRHIVMSLCAMCKHIFWFWLLVWLVNFSVVNKFKYFFFYI